VIDVYCSKIDEMWYGVAIEGDEIVATDFSRSEEEVLLRLLGSLPYDVLFQVAERSSQFSIKVLKTLKAIFNGEDVSLNFNLATKYLSSYTRRVLRCVSFIPVGYVTTYGALAEVVGGSPRAIGRALASNPFLLLVPCHRVVRADLSVGGFGGYGGVETKRKLLRREDRGYEKETKMEAYSRVLALFPIKHLKGINP